MYTRPCELSYLTKMALTFTGLICSVSKQYSFFEIILQILNSDLFLRNMFCDPFCQSETEQSITKLKWLIS